MSKKTTNEPEETWTRFTLILLNGREIIIDCRDDLFEEIRDEMMMELEKGGLWWCGNWDTDKLEIDYLGYNLTSVVMNKVIGIID